MKKNLPDSLLYYQIFPEISYLSKINGGTRGTKEGRDHLMFFIIDAKVKQELNVYAFWFCHLFHEDGFVTIIAYYQLIN